MLSTRLRQISSFSIRGYFVQYERKMPRKVSRFHWELEEIIQKVAERIEIHDIEYVIRYGCEDVDSFFNSTYLVNIRGKRNGQKIKNNIVIKYHIDLNQRSCFRELYHRDHLFYKHIIAKLLEIQRTFSVIEGLRIKFPNCVYSSIEHNKEVMVLSQVQSGYHLFSRSLTVTLDHAKLSLKNLAKLHALSFIWETLYPEEFDEIKSIMRKDVQYSDLDKITNSMKHYYDTSVSVVLNPIYKEKLETLAKDILNVLKSSSSSCVQYSTICHGDCWSNNIIFKYQGTRPVEVMFVDYQLSRYASPVTDISYFLYMSTERQLLFQHYETLINVYYGTLAGVLRQCNLEVEQVYPTTIFREQLKKYSVLGLIEALMSMKIITADNDDAIKITEMKYNRPDISLYECESKNQGLFIERVNAIVDSFFQYDYSLTSVIHSEE